MKTKKYQTDDVRTILTGMIVSDQVLGRIHSHYANETKPFADKWSCLIGRACLHFYGKYKKAPRHSIQQWFNRFSEEHQDDAAAELVGRYLETLSSDYKAQARATNVDFVADLAARHFTLVRADRLRQKLEDAIDRKDDEAVREAVGGFHPATFAGNAAIHLMTDRERVKQAFDMKESDVLIKYPGAVGEFFGEQLERDAFIALMGPEKRGKSAWLQDLAWRAAVKNKRRTLVFVVGDMSENQVIRRYACRACFRPQDKRTVRWPKELRTQRDGSPKLVWKEQTWEKRMSGVEAIEGLSKHHALTAQKNSILRLHCYPNQTANIAMIETVIDDEMRDGWIPDVVVIDYADNLASEPGSSRLEPRHQINKTWGAMRSLSQKYHVLLATATQSASSSYGKSLIRREHFSEDKRKIGHVTGMVGLNQTEDEKNNGIFRLNWIALREGEYFETKCVTVAGSLALANPAMVSAW